VGCICSEQVNPLVLLLVQGPGGGIISLTQIPLGLVLALIKMRQEANLLRTLCKPPEGSRGCFRAAFSIYMLSCFSFQRRQAVYPREQHGDEKGPEDDDATAPASSKSKVYGNEFEKGPPHANTLHWALYNSHAPPVFSPHANSQQQDSNIVTSNKTDEAPSIVNIGSNKTSAPLDSFNNSFPLTHKSSTSTVISVSALPALRYCSTPELMSPLASERLTVISESEAVHDEQRNGVGVVSRATQSDPQDTASSSSSTSIRFKGTPVRYKKGEQLGSGSSGAVYQVLDLETGELLAVKEVTRQDLIDTVEKEAQLMSSLEDHPHIIRYRGMRKEQTRPFSGPLELSLHIFTEWLAGGSVSQLIKSYGPLEEGAARRYTLQILQGLAFLHENKVVHRDVKGSNILIGSNGSVKLGDLGSSRVLASPTSSTDGGTPMAQEVAMSFKGTCFWCPPEVIRMEGHSFSADLYSLGCTVLEMMNGVPPFSEEVEGPLQALMLIASISSEAELSKRLNGCLDFRASLECCLGALGIVKSSLLRQEETVVRNISKRNR
jgi:hypothetical protein